MKNKLDDILRITFLALLLMVLFTFIDHNEIELFDDYQEPTADVNIMYDLPKLDIVITDAVLAHGSSNYTTQLKMSPKINPSYAVNLFLQNKQPLLNFFIDTNGGGVVQSLMIIDNMLSLRDIGYQIDCYTVKAYSMGFTLLQNCSKRIILKGGKLGIHYVSGGSKYVNRLIDIERAKYEVDKTGKTVRELIDMRKEDMKYFTAEEALKEGFVDEVM